MNIIMASSRGHNPPPHHQLPSLSSRLLPNQSQHSQQQQQQPPHQNNQQVQYHLQQHYYHQHQHQQQPHRRTASSKTSSPPVYNLPLIADNNSPKDNQKSKIITPTKLSTPVTSPDKPTSPLDFTDRIPFNELELSNETLGSGSFGTVYKGRWRNRPVAVKQFRTREEIDSFLVEVKQLSCVKHSNIVTLYGASTLSDTAYLVMEYAEGGSLNRLLHESKQQNYTLRHACSWAMQTARGVAYLHSIRPKAIMHRDLKPANLLLFQRGKILKICDFGTACTVKTQMTNNTGSAAYMAPEVFATSSYLESGDVFSWSIIFWEILARRHPYAQQYSNPYQILWSVKQANTRPNELLDCPEPIWNLVTQSWHKNPRARPTMQQVAKKMEFIFSLTDSHENYIKPKQTTTTSQSQHHYQNQSKQLPSHQLESPIGSHSDQPKIPLLSELQQQQNQNQQSTSDVRWFNIGGDSSRNDIHGQSIHSRSPNSDRLGRARCNLLKELAFRCEKLSMREKDLKDLLEQSHQKKYKSDDTLEELKELKRETESKKLELKERLSASLSQRGCVSDHYST